MKAKEIEDIKKYLYLCGDLHNKAYFRCFSEGLAIFHIEKTDTFIEIAFIVAEPEFLSEERLVDILDLKDLLYLSHAEYSKDEELIYTSVDYFNSNYKPNFDDEEDI